MLRLWAFCLVLFTWTPAECDNKRFLLTNEVCYGDLGCFNTKAPFWSLQRPITFLPDTPEKINTRFLLFTRSNQDAHFEMKYNNVAAGSVGPFNPALPTKFVVHGFLQNTNWAWMRDMKSAFLRKAAMNVFLVDWNGGNKFPYTQATANTQVVGAEIARLVKTLNQYAGLSLSNVHILGHSLGSHIAGYAGKRARTIGRITGLDPAEPYFQYTDAVVRLDKTDATLVDIIHSDGSSILNLGLGMIQPIGHLDFFPNGGADQPGCSKNLGKVAGGILGVLSLDYDKMEEAIGCSHIRAIDFVTESIEATTCNFMAYPCANMDDFNAGKCMTCPGGACPQMGFNADKFRGAQGSYYLQTSASGPFCSYHYAVVLSTGQSITGKGTITLKLTGASSSVDNIQLSSGEMEFKSRSTYAVTVRSSTDLGAIRNVVVNFKKTTNLITGLLYPSYVEIASVNVIRGESQQQTNLCTSNVNIQTGASATYTSC